MDWTGRSRHGRSARRPGGRAERRAPCAWAKTTATAAQHGHRRQSDRRHRRRGPRRRRQGRHLPAPSPRRATSSWRAPGPSTSAAAAPWQPLARAAGSRSPPASESSGGGVNVQGGDLRQRRPRAARAAPAPGRPAGRIDFQLDPRRRGDHRRPRGQALGGGRPLRRRGPWRAAAVTSSSSPTTGI